MIWTVFPLRPTGTPKACKQDSVARQSAAELKFVILVSPTAIAARIAARCEIDLSPGTRTVPCSDVAGVIFITNILRAAGAFVLTANAVNR